MILVGFGFFLSQVEKTLLLEIPKCYNGYMSDVQFEGEGSINNNYGGNQEQSSAGAITHLVIKLHIASSEKEANKVMVIFSVVLLLIAAFIIARTLGFF